MLETIVMAILALMAPSFPAILVTDSNRRRDAETYQQEAQGGRNEIRQGSSQPQAAQYQTTTNLQYSGWAVFRNKPISHESTQRHRTHTSHIARTDKKPHRVLLLMKNIRYSNRKRHTFTEHACKSHQSQKEQNRVNGLERELWNILLFCFRHGIINQKAETDSNDENTQSQDSSKVDIYRE